MISKRMNPMIRIRKNRSKRNLPKVFIDISLEELDIQVGRKSTLPAL